MSELAESGAKLHDEEPAPKQLSAARRIVRIVITLLILGAGVAGFFLYKKHAKEKEIASKKAAESEKKVQPTLIRVATSRKARVLRSERYVGELVALRTVDLSPKAPGRILKMTKELGDSVRRGEIVARLDDVEIVRQIEEARTAITVAKATVERAVADVLRANVEVTRADIEAERRRPLFKQQLVTLQEMQNLDAAVSVAKAVVSLNKSAVTVAKAQVAQAEARIPLLRVQIDNLRVPAPFAGRINKRYLDPGAMVAAGTPVYQLVTDEKLLARFKVPERDLSELPKGKTVTLHIEAYPKEKFEGKVIRVSPSVDVATRTAIAEAETSNHEGRLKPGMFARVDVLWSILDDVILVPQRTLVRPPEDPQGPPGLYLYENGKARFVKVTAGIEQGDEIQVRGVAEGATVIVEGQHGLKSGAEVAIAKPAPTYGSAAAAAAASASPAAGGVPAQTPEGTTPAQANAKPGSLAPEGTPPPPLPPATGVPPRDAEKPKEAQVDLVASSPPASPPAALTPPKS